VQFVSISVSYLALFYPSFSSESHLTSGWVACARYLELVTPVRVLLELLRARKTFRRQSLRHEARSLLFTPHSSFGFICWNGIANDVCFHVIADAKVDMNTVRVI
jgi:hypothetical protein